MSTIDDIDFEEVNPPVDIGYELKVENGSKTFKCYDEISLTFLRKPMRQSFVQKNCYYSAISEYPLTELEEEYDYQSDEE
jgi:hypothetical protein